MKTAKTLVTCGVVALIGLGFSAWVWPELPDPMPIHWNLRGVADGFGPRWLGATLLPATALGVPGLIALFAANDPRRENIRRSARAMEAMLELGTWVAEGRLVYKTDVVDGLEESLEDQSEKSNPGSGIEAHAEENAATNRNAHRCRHRGASERAELEIIIGRPLTLPPKRRSHA